MPCVVTEKVGMMRSRSVLGINALASLVNGHLQCFRCFLCLATFSASAGDKKPDALFNCGFAER